MQFREIVNAPKRNDVRIGRAFQRVRFGKLAPRHAMRMRFRLKFSVLWTKRHKRPAGSRHAHNQRMAGKTSFDLWLERFHKIATALGAIVGAYFALWTMLSR